MRKRLKDGLTSPDSTLGDRRVAAAAVERENESFAEIPV
jgi:hypothetical protein